MTLLLLLGGCGLPGHNYLTELSCEHDAYGWAGGLTRWVDAGPGDGTFDLQPPEVEISSVKGSYDTETGDFSYEVTYAPGYYLVRGEFEGYGTVYENGDLDILYTETLTDVLDAVYVREVRMERTGCDTTGSWTDWFESPEDLDGASRDWNFTATFVSADEVDSEVAYDVGGESYLREATSWSDFVTDYQTSVTSTSYTYEADGRVASDATVREDFVQTASDASTYEGFSQQAFDGSTHFEYDYSDADGTLLMSCVFDYAYDGSGEGTCTYTEEAGGYDCDISITADGDCTYACEANGQTFEGTC